MKIYNEKKIMKNLILIAIFLLTLNIISCASENSQNTSKIFNLNLQWTRAEHSKDSNSTHYRIIISGKKVIYNENYSGFTYGPGKKYTFLLNDDELIKLIVLICKNNLMKSMSEKKPSNHLGNAVHIELTINLNGQTSKTSIHGMTFDFKNRKSNLKNYKQTEKIYDIISLLNSIIQKRGLTNEWRPRKIINPPDIKMGTNA